jgi:hypothetical protein
MDNVNRYEPRPSGVALGIGARVGALPSELAPPLGQLALNLADDLVKIYRALYRFNLTV